MSFFHHFCNLLKGLTRLQSHFLLNNEIVKNVIITFFITWAFFFSFFLPFFCHKKKQKSKKAKKQKSKKAKKQKSKDTTFFLKNAFLILFFCKKRDHNLFMKKKRFKKIKAVFCGAFIFLLSKNKSFFFSYPCLFFSSS